MRRPKLIGTDLDGTIVPFDRPISQRTIDAFTKAHSLGVEIYFVTGRPPRWMKEVRETFEFGTGICGNGALLYDFREEKILDSWLINPEELAKGAAALRQVIPDAAFAVENFHGFHREKSYNPRWDKGQDDLGVSVIEEHLSQPAIKFLVRSASEDVSADQMLALADAVTFGDNPNDLSMLAWAGRSYAMKTGHPATHAIATGIAPECNDDGVAQVIEELLNLPE